jgi:signal transduction histidine kinase
MNMQRIKRHFHSLYWRQFMLTAGMVLLSMLLLGVSFFALSYNYTVAEKRTEMQNRAELIAQMSAIYLTAGEADGIDQDGALRSMAGVATMMTDVDFLICNREGSVLLTSDQDLVGRVIKLPDDVRDESLHGVYEGRSTMDIYEQQQFVVGVPIHADGAEGPIGVVVAVMDSTELTEMWRSFIGLFFMTSAIILLIAFVASSLTAMRQIQPIQEMVRATRAYAAGDFDVRMQDGGRGDEVGELAASFNVMADSLAETERQRRDFIANISHELKTPMTTIAGYTDGILDGTIPPEKERPYLQIISDESRRLSRLVRRMLDISQIQSQEMKKEEFDLCESMRLALVSMEQKILDRGLDVDADIPEDSVMVEGVNDLITQVIYNLLENATKFAAPSSTLYLGLHTTGEKAVVTVRNQGSTIPAEEIPLLFERFHKSDKSRSEDKDGYGLGLYVVKTILSQHKEKITVTSENGVTAFSFTVQMAGAAHGN